MTEITRPSSRTELGIWLTEKGKLKIAMGLFQEEIRKRPNYLAYYGYATAKYEESRSIVARPTDIQETILRECLENYEKSVSLNPNFAPSCLLLGMIHKIMLLKKLMQSKSAEAFQELDRMIKTSISQLERAAELCPKYSGIVQGEICDLTTATSQYFDLLGARSERN